MSFNKTLFVKALVAGINNLLHASLISEHAINIRSVTAGSVVVEFDVIVPAIAAASMSDVVCSVQAGVYNGLLLEQLLDVGGALYQTVNVQFLSSAGCTTCVCPSPLDQLSASLRCPPLYTPLNATHCTVPAWCANGTAASPGGCGSDAPSCPSNGALSLDTAGYFCVASIANGCPVGWTLFSSACVIECPINSQSNYTLQQGQCVREIACPPGYFLNATAPLRSLCALPLACNAVPCMNGGTCVATGLTAYVCACQAGHRGLHCELQAACTGSNACINGGTCVPDATSTDFTCRCPATYSGRTCEQLVQSSAASSSSGSAGIGAGIGAGVGCIVLVVIIVVLLRRSRSQVASKASTSNSVSTLADDMELDPRNLIIHEPLREDELFTISRGTLVVCFSRVYCQPLCLSLGVCM